MKLYTIDKIVRSALADKEYPMHFYLQYLTYAINGMRELTFDVLKNIKSVRLPVTSYGAIKLPCDFVDYVRVGEESNQYVTVMSEKRQFNRLNKFDQNGKKVPYENILSSSSNGGWDSDLYNDKGELTGRVFNAKPTYPDSFILLRERGEIQLDPSFTGSEVVLDYISDGVNTTASNAVHPYAIESIKSYIFWKQKEHGRNYNRQESELAKNEFYNQLRILRGRLSDINDINDIRRSLASGYGANIKY